MGLVMFAVSRVQMARSSSFDEQFLFCVLSAGGVPRKNKTHLQYSGVPGAEDPRPYLNLFNVMKFDLILYMSM